jgi:hypothetical protein
VALGVHRDSPRTVESRFEEVILDARREPTGSLLLPLAFVLLPGPYKMAVFTFLAQPLFAIAAIGYLLKVLAELRHYKVM